MLGVSAVAQFMSGPGQSYSVAAFKEPMRDSLGVSETSYAMAYAVATILSGLSLPWMGKLLDRIGARMVLPCIAALFAASCMFMSLVGDLPNLYIGFTLVRCLGQGALCLVAIWIVGEWFLHKRGFATALSGLGGSLSVMLFPVLNYYAIRHLGWEAAWQLLGLTIAVSLIVPPLFLLRDRPEDIGLLPDGIDSEKDNSVSDFANGRNSPTLDSWSLQEVLRDATFWKLLSVGICSGMVGTGMIFHQVSLLGTRSVCESFALALISLQAIVASIAALGAGWVTDRWRAERLLAIASFMLAVAVAIVQWMPISALALGYAALMGLHGSILRSAGTVVWINYYGRQNQGVIRGAAMSAMILAAAVGPIPLAISVDRLGTYTPALLAYVALPLVSMLLVLSAKQPIRPADAA